MVPLEIPHAPSTKSVLGTWYRFHHSNNPNVELRLEEKDGLAIVTFKIKHRIAAGEELVIKYDNAPKEWK